MTGLPHLNLTLAPLGILNQALFLKLPHMDLQYLTITALFYLALNLFLWDTQVFPAVWLHKPGLPLIHSNKVSDADGCILSLRLLAEYRRCQP